MKYKLHRRFFPFAGKGHGNVSIGNPAPLCGKDMSINAVEKSLSKDRLILVTAQKDLTDEDPLPGRIYFVGVVSQIMRMLRLPDGRVKVLMQGLKKAKIVEYVQRRRPF